MEITPTLLLRAYAHGLFPMADDADSEDLYWFDPPLRGVIPLDGFHIPRSLRKTVRRDARAGGFEVRFDTAFEDTIRACAEPTPDRPKTWISETIVDLYLALYRSGNAHSVETWRAPEPEAEPELAGGLYGVAMGGAFFGESMFSRTTDASKVALVHLVATLKAGGFSLLDTQFITDHLARFGACEIPQRDYKCRLSEAMRRRAVFEPVTNGGQALALLEA